MKSSDKNAGISWDDAAIIVIGQRKSDRPTFKWSLFGKGGQSGISDVEQGE
jgi:hypothetical protein